MTRRGLSIVTVAALCFAAAGLIDASAQTARDGKMRILGRATVEATPDYAVVRIGITNKAATPSAALDQNSTIARKMIEFAKRFGIDEKNIQTDSVNLQPATKSVRDPNGNFRQEPDGYIASNLIRAKLTELARLGSFMRQILDEGATNIAGVEFGVSNVEQVADQARAQAVENAIHQAQRCAKSGVRPCRSRPGPSRSRPRSISPGSSSESQAQPSLVNSVKRLVTASGLLQFYATILNCS